MSSSLTRRNHLALGALVIAKVLGIVAVVLMYVGARTGGVVLLALDAVFIVGVVVVTLRAMRAPTDEDDVHKQALAQMIREGTLEQKLRELELESRASSS